MAAITGAIIGGVAAVAGAKMQSDAASKGRKAAKQGRDQQYGFLREGQEKVEGYTQPYRDAGENALGAMQGMLGIGGQSYDIKTDPGYQFRFGEGVRAMDASASARGSMLSGGAMKDLTTFGQDSASQEYMNIFKRLQTLAGGGLSATGMVSNAAMGTGTGLAQAAGDFGNTSASGYVAQGNVGAGLMGDLGSIVGGMDWGGGGGNQSRRSGLPEAGIGGRSVF
jgi:hypothetical protein